jgi:hypothetical protein
MIKIDWIETKDDGWKLASITDAEGHKLLNVSINRTSNKGEVFPNFDNLAAGMDIEAVTWQSKAGKWYLFPPKPQTTQGEAYTKPQGGFKAGMQKMAEEKREFIKDTQEIKNSNIREAAAQRDAVLIVTTFYPEFANDPLLSTEKEKLIKQKYLQWRDMFLNQEPFADTNL